jgi:hypothetical protein
MSPLESEIILEEQRRLTQKIMDIVNREIRGIHNERQDEVKLERTKEIDSIEPVLLDAFNKSEYDVRRVVEVDSNFSYKYHYVITDKLK